MGFSGPSKFSAFLESPTILIVVPLTPKPLTTSMLLVIASLGAISGGPLPLQARRQLKPAVLTIFYLLHPLSPLTGWSALQLLMTLTHSLIAATVPVSLERV